MGFYHITRSITFAVGVFAGFDGVPHVSGKRLWVWINLLGRFLCGGGLCGALARVLLLVAILSGTRRSG